MRRYLAVLALPALLVLVPLQTAVSQEAESDGTDAESATSRSATSQPAAQGDIERGRYLVEGVGMCGQCHTPRSADGELLMEKWLKGAPVPVTTPEGYTDKWVYKAPRIAGLPQHTDEEFVRLMTTSINRDGLEVNPPMPPFRLSEEDALAIAAYLRSLG